MAYPAPPTLGAGAIPSSTPITSYLQKYQEKGDALEGRYQEFLAPYAPDSGCTHTQLEARILSTTGEVPKVFLGLVEHAGVILSVTLHRPAQYASHPIDASVRKPHRDCSSPNNCFRSGTRQQRTYHGRASGNAGGTTQCGTIRPIRRQHTRHTIHHGPEHGPCPTSLRASCAGPSSQPMGAMGTSWGGGGGGGGIINDRHEMECRELLNWLRYALTLRRNPSGTPTALPPGSSLGAIGAALPTLRVDAPLQNHRWNILRQDLPALDPSRLAPTDQVVHLVQALRDEQAATCLAEVEVRSWASAPKTPSATFPQMAAHWRT